MNATITPLPDPYAQPAFYAGVPFRRAMAWVIDCALIAILAAIATPFTAFTALFFFPAFMAVVGFIYRWWMLSAASSTFGMMVMGIELREANGMSLDGRTAFWHTAAYTAAVIMAPAQLVSAILMLTTQRGQGLGDMVLGTVMLRRSL